MTTVPGRSVPIGYPWRQRLTIAGETPTFPAGIELRADLREWRGGPVLAEMTSAAGQLVRVSDTEIDLIAPADVTAMLRPGSALLDFVRTDLPEPEYMDIRVTLPVVEPLTPAVVTP